MQFQRFFVLALCMLSLLVLSESRRTDKKCKRGRLQHDTKILYNKTAEFKAHFPRDNITNIRLLTKELKQDFMAQENCDLREDLLEFYCIEVLKKPGVLDRASDIIATIQIIQLLLKPCAIKCDLKSKEVKSFEELKKSFKAIPKSKKSLWKAISEMDILLEWIYEYIVKYGIKEKSSD